METIKEKKFPAPKVGGNGTKDLSMKQVRIHEELEALNEKLDLLLAALKPKEEKEK